MDLYDASSRDLSRRMTDAYSTSFGLSIRLFPKHKRGDIYALYGLVRIADEIVDTYRGENAEELLTRLEDDVTQALTSGYSANPIVHAYADTARRAHLEPRLLQSFFASMRMDLQPPSRYTRQDFDRYIHGSAEVIGLMMLQLFVNDNEYKELAPAASRLGAAYQKINFLRDLAADHQIGRWYFPEGSFATFDDATKEKIIDEIQRDLDAGKQGIDALPRSARKAVLLSYRYYSELQKALRHTPAGTLRRTRVRVTDGRKLLLFVRTYLERLSS